MGVRLEVEGGKLIVEFSGEAPDGLLAKLKEHKLSIVSILKQEAAVIRPLEPEERARPSWWPKPQPRIAREPPFGSDGVPPRYRAAWDAVLAQCPAGMAPFVWETAMYDAARLFGDFGIELERLAWKPDDLFGLPNGLVWFIKGKYVATIGATMAQLSDDRIWRAAP